ncbi:MAG: peptidoglycan-binding protein [Proteobacteria bacterium]|nr:peptidoglycan-binding protein [Pseudomonadota bacterium]
MSSGTATVTASSLNVRKGAGTSYAKIGSLKKGKTVNYSAEKSGWLQINYNSQTGYISKAYTNTTSGSTGGSSTSSGSTSSVKLTNAQINSAVSYNKKNCQHLCTKIQKLVGVTADGSFGPVTVQAIANWQASQGLTADGQFGPKSQAKAGFNDNANDNKPSTDNSSNHSSNTSSKLLNDKEVQAAITYNKNNCSSICKEIQKLVGVTADGSFGPVTVQAIATWQKNNGLTADGQFGPKSQNKSGIKPSVKETQQDGTGLNKHTKNYKQYASPWGPKMYSIINDKSQTYASSACGPTACASIIASKVDSSVTPYTLGQWAIEKGYRTRNDGTAHAFVPKVAAKYGMTATECSVDTGIKKLQAGHYCVSVMKAGYWTNGGHYITPYASDGSTIYVDDPGHSSRPNGFKQGKKDFKSECRKMWYFS